MSGLAHAQTVIVEAETMTLNAGGGPSGSEMMILSNGMIQSNVTIPSAGYYHIDVIARGDIAQGVGPVMDVRVDNVGICAVTATSSPVTYSIGTLPLTAGIHTLTIAFTNDFYDGVMDRNLIVDKTTFSFTMVSSTQVTQGKWKLEWDPNVETDLAGYRVYRMEQIGYVLVGSTTVPTYQDITALSGHTYNYVVTAYDTSMNESCHSNMVVAVVAPGTDIMPPQVALAP